MALTVDSGTSSINTVGIEPLNELDNKALQACVKTCQKVQRSVTPYLVLINVATQRLHLFENETHTHSYAVSTAAKGTGQQAGSGQTPLGLLFVDEKIGEGCSPYAIFDSRKATGEYSDLKEEKSLIIGRILWLSGAESGYNQGKDSGGQSVDTKTRYIYIHGTNKIQEIGRAASAGCIRMHPDQVVELFNRVPEQTPVYVYAAPFNQETGSASYGSSSCT